MALHLRGVNALIALGCDHPQHHDTRVGWLHRNAVTGWATCGSGGVVGHRRITDAYLLTAAMRAGMTLLTFDSSLSTLLASDAERSAPIDVLR